MKHNKCAKCQERNHRLLYIDADGPTSCIMWKTATSGLQFLHCVDCWDVRPAEFTLEAIKASVLANEPLEDQHPTVQSFVNKFRYLFEDEIAIANTSDKVEK